MTKQYDIIIVNYNGDRIISACLSSALNSSIKPNKIIIYDNHSDDNSVQLIKQKFPSVILIEGKKNIGFGPGNNQALKYAKSNDVLFMNNDILLDKRCAEVLLQRLDRDNDIAIVNPLIYKGWDKKNNHAVYSFGATLNQAGFSYSRYDIKDNTDRLTCFSGACFMARTKFVREFQFEPNFFLYYEEAELSTKILKKGLKIARAVQAVCYHLESYSSPKQISSGIGFRQFYAVQNRWFIIGKHWPTRLLPIAFCLNTAYLIYILFFFLTHHQLSYLKLIYLAPYKYYLGLKYRSHHLPRNPRWYAQLTITKLSEYITLNKKVFTK